MSDEDTCSCGFRHFVGLTDIPATWQCVACGKHPPIDLQIVLDFVDVPPQAQQLFLRLVTPASVREVARQIRAVLYERVPYDMAHAAWIYHRGQGNERLANEARQTILAGIVLALNELLEQAREEYESLPQPAQHSEHVH